jgi:hypothetical protein
MLKILGYGSRRAFLKIDGLEVGGQSKPRPADVRNHNAGSSFLAVLLCAQWPQV